jgi:hypothetical protein
MTLYTYCISFRIADRTVNGRTYDERRQSLIAAVRGNNGFWDGTTSLLLVESTLDTNALTKRASAGLSAEYDQLVVFDPGDMSMGHFGKVPNLDVLKSFFRHAYAVAA